MMRLKQNNYINIVATALAVPVCLLAACLSFNMTVIVFLFMGCTIFYMRKRLIFIQPREKDRERSQLFFVWLSSSLLSIMVIFHAFVVGLLEILPEENFVLLLVATLSILFLYNTKQRANQVVQLSKAAYNGDIESMSEDKLSLIPSTSPLFCNICQVNIPSREGHCVWLDCCISADNKCKYYLGLVLGVIALFYGSNLALTTVCHPFIFYKSVLLPEDCSEVYLQFNTSISFVSGVYGSIIGSVILLQHFFRILKRFVNFTVCCNVANKTLPGGIMELFLSRTV